MKIIQLLAFSPALMYNARFLNFFLNPGDGTSYNGGDIEDEDILEDENMEDEDLPDEAPPKEDEGISFVADDGKTPPEKEESNFEANDIDEK